MNCALWLNRKKIFDASEIAENADIGALRGYFLAGSLVPWLRGHNGGEYADALEKLPYDAPDLNERLVKIVTGKNSRKVPAKTLGGTDPTDPQTNAARTFSGNVYASFPTSYGVLSSYSPTSYEFSGYSISSYNFSSYSAGSGGSYTATYTAGSGSFFLTSWTYWLHEWEWEFWLALGRGWGSFSVTSFGSGVSQGWEWLAKLLSGYGYGSFSFGSFGSFGHISFGEYGSFCFSPEQLLEKLAELDEYDRIMLETLALCPLDRYGYGIHMI